MRPIRAKTRPTGHESESDDDKQELQNLKNEVSEIKALLLQLIPTVKAAQSEQELPSEEGQQEFQELASLQQDPTQYSEKDEEYYLEDFIRPDLELNSMITHLRSGGLAVPKLTSLSKSLIRTFYLDYRQYYLLGGLFTPQQCINPQILDDIALRSQTSYAIW